MKFCRGDEIGNHATLKMLWSQGLEGSSPSLGTPNLMPKQKLPHKNFIWKPELAYAIGLLVTDGNLSKDGRHINFRSSEIDLLNTFKKCLNLKNKIGHTDNQRGYRVQFGNVQFYNWLLKIGLTPAKTHTIGEIKIPDLYFRDFLRGHLDGDGSITAYTDRYNIYRGRTYVNKRLFVRFTSASEIHTNWLYKKINTILGIKGAVIYKPPATPNRVPMRDIKFAKKESIKLLQQIYYKNDLPCLKRKRVIAEKAMGKIIKEKRRKYTRIK